MTRILVVNGHPDPKPATFIAALADAYAAGALEGGHEIRRIDIGAHDIPFIASAAEFSGEPTEPALKAAQADILWAEHLVFVFPLWLGGVPAKLKAFLEQTFRYGFALPREMPANRFPKGLLGGRSARVIVTMGTPAFLYRLVFGAVGVRALESGILKLSGLKPVRRLIVGGAGAMTPETARRRLDAARALGRAAR